LESELRALFLKETAHRHYHSAKAIGADVGSLEIKNVGRSSEADKICQDFRNTGIVEAGVKFPVGKGSCSPFAELHVTFDLQRSLLPKPIHIFDPGRNFLSSLQNQGRKAASG
jgi:hypothetical protein